MQIFKFGGASVRDAVAVRNVAKIISEQRDDQTLVVVSAMGKTTTLMEGLASSWYANQDDKEAKLQHIKECHGDIINDLFPERHEDLDQRIAGLFAALEETLDNHQPTYPTYQDQIVIFGELISTSIITAYLSSEGLDTQWMDVREMIHTDDQYGDAEVQWDKTEASIKEAIHVVWPNKIPIVQGFIGRSNEGLSTTLGREGSDYTASIFGSILEADRVIVWKDVEGILAADPKEFSDPPLIQHLSYYEVIEMTYYGAKVIHPKTIKPLFNKGIELQVRSFVNPNSTGTFIRRLENDEQLPPIIVLKPKQELLSLSTKDFSFISDDALSVIYGAFAKEKIKINLMQISALSLSVVVDYKPRRISRIVHELEKEFGVKRNDLVDMVTIRHYDEDAIDRISKGKEILLEQKSRNTVQLVFRSTDSN